MIELILLEVGNNVYQIVPNDEDLFPFAPLGGEILGVVPPHLRIMHYASKYLTDLFWKRARALRKDFTKGEISKEVLLREKKDLLELRAARKEIDFLFLFAVALYFSKNGLISPCRIRICRGWKAVITQK